MTAPQQTNREWLKMMSGRFTEGAFHERFASCAAEIEQLVAALKDIAAGYECTDVSHVDFRVKTKQIAEAALAAVERRT